MANGSINLSGSAGKIALLNDNTSIGAVTCPIGSDVLDVVSYGSTATACDGLQAPGEPNSTTSVIRIAGNPDTGNNSADFTTASPPNPRNSSGSSAVSLTLLNPSSIPFGSGDTPLTLTGMGFGSDSVVNFSGRRKLCRAPADISASSIQITVPASYLVSAGTLPCRLLRLERHPTR